jgi:hypothetical protein
MEPGTIDDALRDHFAPVVRRAGFTGSGRNFRRLDGALVSVVNVQGSMAGGQFCINLGVHPVALLEGDPRKIKEYQCLLRSRLAEDGQSDQWWRYGDDPASLTAAARSAAQLFEAKAVRLFAEQTGKTAPLLIMTPEAMAAGERFSGFGCGLAPTALALGRLRKLAGDDALAAAFGRLGLANTPPSAYILRQELEELVSDGA